MKRFAAVIFAVASLAMALPAGAETFRLVAPDGTIHFTNAPTDPRYRRQGMTPPGATGTGAGWFRLPSTDLAPYMSEIRAAAERYALPEALISAVIRVESGFNPRAVSRKGARGLMQLMPSTASILGVRNSFDPGENIDGGARHLRGLIERFSNDVPLALAAYNAGENAVVTYRGIPPYAETQDYVARVLRFFYGTTTNGTTLPTETFKKLESDGTVVYTNIPPRPRL